jgi:hypothetical protein
LLMLALTVCAIVVGGSVKRLGSCPTAGRCLCSNGAGTRVNLLKYQEKL